MTPASLVRRLLGPGGVPTGSPRPRKVLVELTRACNLRCAHCAVSAPGYVGQSLPWDAFERLLPALRRDRPLVELSGHGESLVYKRFFDAFAAVVEAGCQVSFISNATLLTPALSERMLAYAGPKRWSNVTISIDAAEPELFERLRRGARFANIVANLEALRDAKRRLGTEYPKVSFNMVLMRDNLSQVEPVVRLAARVGAVAVSIVELLEYEHFSGHRLDDGSVELRDSLASAREAARQLGVQLELMPGLKALLGEAA